MLWCSTSFGMFSKGRYVSLGVSVYQGGCILPPGTLICRKLFVPSTGLDFPFAVPPKGRGGKTANRHSVFKIEMTHSCMYNIHIYFFIFLMEYKILHIHITYYIQILESLQSEVLRTRRCINESHHGWCMMAVRVPHLIFLKLLHSYRPSRNWRD